MTGTDTMPPIDLFTSFIHLGDGGQVHPEPQVFKDSGRDGWHLMTFHVETDADVHADHWEVHPEAEELVTCLTGGIRLYFRPERQGEQEEETKLTPGAAVIVPRGRWHRIELDAPSDIMSVTVRRGSRLERRGEA
ncbi:cupin domain-containing protein [Streptomyces violascens]|uniref:cupin domain-containing protein n=1 Tax=Streptomyces violascens TaxID=67381 RepID=UPI003698B641